MAFTPTVFTKLTISKFLWTSSVLNFKQTGEEKMWQNCIYALIYSMAFIALIFMNLTTAAQHKVKISIKFHPTWSGNTSNKVEVYLCP
jgi:hypothetical protein